MDTTPLSMAARPIWQRMRYVVLAIFGMAILIAPAASAHTLKTDGATSAVLHFQPDDNPMSGKPAEYILFLNDSTKRFSLDGCNCTVTIQKDGKTLSAKSVRLNSQNIIGGSITFAEAGAYEVTFQGTPIKADAFQPFTLTYIEQVLPNPDTNRPSAAFIFGMSALVVSMIIIALWIKVRYNTLEGVKK